MTNGHYANLFALPLQYAFSGLRINCVRNQSCITSSRLVEMEMDRSPSESPGLAKHPEAIVATDADAMTRKYVELESGLEIASTIAYTWEIADWHALAEKELSQEFEAGGQRWQLLLYPEGNPVNRSRGHIALYLKALPPTGASSDASQKWHVCATFALALWNPQHPEVFVCQSAKNRFGPSVSDWGYGEFTPLRGAFVPTHHHQWPLIEGPVNVTCYLVVLRDPTGVLWHDFSNYNSRDETGYTGLMNQGATCYLNSLLQSLYFTKIFRQAVYDIPGDADGVVGGMQRLFYLLATSPQPVGTMALTKAFGWDTADAFQQHDVQEMCRVLMDKLETRMKGTRVDGALTDIFVGQMKSYIKCINVDFESSRVEDFWDIQLNVKGMRDVKDSFDTYVATEVLEGDNQYQAEGLGLQDAKKGVIFKNFPPVLHLQLKRYDYDWMRDVEVKINDHYEYPLVMDLGEYIERGTPEASENWEYALHGVLVHSGDLNAGHYYALLKPEATGDWFRFDDDRVTRATLHEVLDENFGGDQGSALRRVTSAYMLVYIRRNKVDWVLSSGDDKAPPQAVADQIEAETKAEDERRRILVEQQQFMDVRVLGSAQFRHHRGIGVVPWSTPLVDELESPLAVKVRRQAPIHTLRSQLGAESLWLVPAGRFHRQARMQLLRDVHEMQPMSNLVQWGDEYSPYVFAEDKPGNPDHQRLLFVKVFDPTGGDAGQGEFRGVGTRWVDNTDTVSTAFDARMVWLEPHAAATGVDSLRALASDMTVGDAGLVSGDCVIVQLDGDRPASTLSAGTSIPTAESLFRILLHSVVVFMRPKDFAVATAEDPTALSGPMDSDSESEEEEQSALRIVASTSLPYSRFVEAVARTIASTTGTQVDPLRLQLWTCTVGWRPMEPLRSDGSNLDKMWTVSSAVRSGDTACGLYRILDRPLSDFEQNVELLISLIGGDTVPEEEPTSRPHNVLLEPTQVLGDALTRLGLSGPLRIWSTLSSSVWGRPQAVELEANIQAADLADLASPIYVGRLIASEKHALQQPDSRPVGVFHFSKDPWRAWGLPFILTLFPDETVAQLRRRVQETLGYSERAADKIRFAVCFPHRMPRYLDDQQIVAEELGTDDELGLDHVDVHRQAPHQATITIR